MRRAIIVLLPARLTRSREPIPVSHAALAGQRSIPVIAGRAAEDERDQAQDGQAEAEGAGGQGEANALPVAIQQMCHRDRPQWQ